MYKVIKCLISEQRLNYISDTNELILTFFLYFSYFKFFIVIESHKYQKIFSQTFLVFLWTYILDPFLVWKYLCWVCNFCPVKIKSNANPSQCFQSNINFYDVVIIRVFPIKKHKYIIFKPLYIFLWHFKVKDIFNDADNN